MKYADFIHVFILEKDTTKNITKPNTIFNSCDNAKGFHEPPPALNKTIMENNRTTHMGINNTNENRESFSLKLIIFALETRVVIDILL